MLVRKYKLILITVLSLIFIVFSIIFCAFLYGVPNSTVSVAAFKIGYILTPDKKTYLELYSPVKRDVGAGYIPPGVGNFLCENAETSTDEKEISAIVDFYTIHEGRREGQCIYAVSEQAKQKIIGKLIKNLDENLNLERKFILLEEIRRGRSLGKGKIGTSSFAIDHPSTAQEWQLWTEKALPIAKTKFQEWWNSNLSWEEKKKINPLEGSIVGVHECCG